MARRWRSSPRTYPVPPDSRKRRVVGNRLHRMDQRRRARPLSPATSSRTSPRTSVFTIRCLRCASPGRHGPSARRQRVLLLALLVRGHRLLQRPFEEVLVSRRPTSPSASPGPTRRGRGSGTEPRTGSWWSKPIRVPTTTAHFAYLRKAFEDPRYVTVGGRPLLLIYKPGGLPQPALFVESGEDGRDGRLGGLYLVASLGDRLTDSQRGRVRWCRALRLPPSVARCRREFGSTCWRKGLTKGPRHYPYPEVPSGSTAERFGRTFPSVYPNWDNTPRLGRLGMVATGTTPTGSAPTSNGPSSWPA